MYPFDVAGIDTLINLLIYLESDINFLGGAVAAPYKESVAKWLGNSRLYGIAAEVGAVNCIFRDTNGFLRGCNTDAEASVLAYEKQFGSMSSKNVLVMGFGGVGRAVVAQTKETGAVVSVVTTKKRTDLDRAHHYIGWDNVNAVLGKVDILINATDLGFSGSGKQDLSPLSKNQLLLLPKNCIVYDLIYQPEKTVLLSMCNNYHIKTINGQMMNRIQAANGFKYVNNNILELEEIYRIMND